MLSWVEHEKSFVISGPDVFKFTILYNAVDNTKNYV